MGLDMYAYAFDRNCVENPDALVDLNIKPDQKPAQDWYWRKFNHLHGWMERLYRSRQGAGKYFNCNTLRLTSEDFDQLDRIVGELEREDTANLPATRGYFFGSDALYPEDVASLKQFVAEGRQQLAQGRVVIYDSWW